MHGKDFFPPRPLFHSSPFLFVYRLNIIFLLEYSQRANVGDNLLDSFLLKSICWNHLLRFEFSFERDTMPCWRMWYVHYYYFFWFSTDPEEQKEIISGSAFGGRWEKKNLNWMKKNFLMNFCHRPLVLKVSHHCNEVLWKEKLFAQEIAWMRISICRTGALWNGLRTMSEESDEIRLRNCEVAHFWKENHYKQTTIVRKSKFYSNLNKNCVGSTEVAWFFEFSIFKRTIFILGHSNDSLNYCLLKAIHPNGAFTFRK